MTTQKWILGFFALCLPLFTTDVCETAVASTNDSASRAGLFSDAETTRAAGGVGNYAFRTSKRPTEPAVEDDYSYSTRSSAIRPDTDGTRRDGFTPAR